MKIFYGIALIAMLAVCAQATSQDIVGNNRGAAAQILMVAQAGDADDAADADDDSMDVADDDEQTADNIVAAQEAIANAIAAFNVQDYPAAVKWFSIGAYKYHDPRAQNDLAKFYANGLGTEQDYGKALKLFNIAAAHGTGKIKADAESAIGTMYAKGWGVPQDSEKALRWLKQSATHGNQVAKTNLAILRQPGSSFKSNAARIHSGSLHMAVARPNKEKKSNGRNIP